MNQQIVMAVKKAIKSRGCSIPQLSDEIGMTYQQMYTFLGMNARQHSPNIRTAERVLDGAGLVLIAVDPETAALLGGLADEL